MRRMRRRWQRPTTLVGMEEEVLFWRIAFGISMTFWVILLVGWVTRGEIVQAAGLAPTPFAWPVP